MLPNSDISTDIGLSADGMNRLYHYIQSWIDEGHAPGAAVGIARNGCQLSPRGFGRMGLAADAAPLPPDAIFLTASVTKPVSCIRSAWQRSGDGPSSDDPHVRSARYDTRKYSVSATPGAAG